MKFKLKATDGTHQIVVRFDDSYLPDVLTQVGSFLQGCGFNFGEQSLELVPWEEEKTDWPVEIDAYETLSLIAMDTEADLGELIRRLKRIVAVAENTQAQRDYEAQLGK